MMQLFLQGRRPMSGISWTEMVSEKDTFLLCVMPQVLSDERAGVARGAAAAWGRAEGTSSGLATNAATA
jgi:hypothetical protein